MRSSRDDLEFGVPFPGEVVARPRWTRTVLSRWPLGQRLNFRELFGRDAPVVVDLGCGNGRYLIASALARPDHDHLGVDNLPVVVRYATRRANQRGLTNVRFAVGDARDVVERLLEPHTVSEIHLYHPQPYYDVADVNRRLVRPEFLVSVHRALVPGGMFVVQTDNPGYWRYIREVVTAFFELTEHPDPWSDAPQGRTRREIVVLQRGWTVYRAVGRARLDLNEAAAAARASRLPPPLFDADRRLRELDRFA